jgi:hypothetical protein
VTSRTITLPFLGGEQPLGVSAHGGDFARRRQRRSRTVRPPTPATFGRCDARRPPAQKSLILQSTSRWCMRDQLTGCSMSTATSSRPPAARPSPPACRSTGSRATPRRRCSPTRASTWCSRSWAECSRPITTSPPTSWPACCAPAAGWRCSTGLPTARWGDSSRPSAATCHRPRRRAAAPAVRHRATRRRAVRRYRRRARVTRELSTNPSARFATVDERIEYYTTTFGPLISCESSPRPRAAGRHCAPISRRSTSAPTSPANTSSPSERRHDAHQRPRPFGVRP